MFSRRILVPRIPFCIYIFTSVNLLASHLHFFVYISSTFIIQVLSVLMELPIVHFTIIYVLHNPSLDHPRCKCDPFS
ncbi:hypothetical protein F5050DRAFT_1484818 [Lentinula boryana]|uniref:Uncharacterized protein n=1 Tax=Lentinula boryana TaxID=40481 RepID=A0ABQ8QEX6_9AGAR|nr:hypothetical protein F5050DRAFT_1484818 [Lentinula boryana]